MNINKCEYCGTIANTDKMGSTLECPKCGAPLPAHTKHLAQKLPPPIPPTPAPHGTVLR